MKRNSSNYSKYKKSCKLVIERSDERCEVMVDGARCGKFIPFDQARNINFMHTDTRNGKSDEWVLDPENIIYGCGEHHISEEHTGKRVERCNYEEIYYVPDNN